MLFQFNSINVLECFIEEKVQHFPQNLKNIRVIFTINNIFMIEETTNKLIIYYPVFVGRILEKDKNFDIKNGIQYFFNII